MKLEPRYEIKLSWDNLVYTKNPCIISTLLNEYPTEQETKEFIQSQIYFDKESVENITVSITQIYKAFFEKDDF